MPHLDGVACLLLKSLHLTHFPLSALPTLSTSFPWRVYWNPHWQAGTIHYIFQEFAQLVLLSQWLLQQCNSPYGTCMNPGIEQGWCQEVQSWHELWEPQAKQCIWLNKIFETWGQIHDHVCCMLILLLLCLCSKLFVVSWLHSLFLILYVWCTYKVLQQRTDCQAQTPHFLQGVLKIFF